MSSLRGALLGRALYGLIAKQPLKSTSVRLQSVRNSHVVNYRTGAPPPSRATAIGAEVVAGLMWWWILYHLFTEYEHVTGEFEYPDPSSWTNAELGIPPDDVE